MNQSLSLRENIDALMREFGIGPHDIARHADVDVNSVETALDSRWLSRCPIIILLKVRNTLETLLSERGWRGDRELLWGDLNTMLAALEAEVQSGR